MPAPEVKENFPICTCAGRFQGGQKREREGLPAHNTRGHTPTGLRLEAILAKSGAHILGRVLGPVRWEERSKAKNKHRPQRTVLWE